MATFVSNSSNVTVMKCGGDEMNTLKSTQAASYVVGAQVGATNKDASDLNVPLMYPVGLNFSFNTVVNGSTYRCVYWNFSNP